MFTAIVLGIGMAALVFVVTQFYRTYWNIPPVPTRESAVADMVALATLQPGERVADLGSGDGRIVVAFARAGAEAHGYESNLFLVLIARRKIRKTRLGNIAHVHWANFWKVDLSPFNVVTIYGMPYLMKPLERKLQAELHPGARVLSNYFEFPNWTALRTQRDIHLYAVSGHNAPAERKDRVLRMVL